MTKDESREIVYGMPYDEWRAKHQKEASPDTEGRLREGQAAALRRSRRYGAEPEFARLAGASPCAQSIRKPFLSNSSRVNSVDDPPRSP